MLIISVLFTSYISLNWIVERRGLVAVPVTKQKFKDGNISLSSTLQRIIDSSNVSSINYKIIICRSQLSAFAKQ